MTVVCDNEQCEYNEDGYCEKEKIHIVGMFCNDNRFKSEESEDTSCN